MTKQIKPVLFFATAMFTFLTITLKAQTKIGVISLQELISSMPDAVKADSALQNFQKELQSTYVDMVKEYQAKDSAFVKDSAKYSSTTKELKKTDLARLAQQIQGFQQSVDETLQRKQQELLTPIKTKATDAIQDYAKKYGYTYVAEKGIFYHFPASDDILEGVKKELKSPSKSTSPAANKPAATNKK